MGWVCGEARVPDHRDGVLGDVEGCGAGHQGRCGGAFAEARGCGEDEVALGEDFEGGSEVRNANGDAALQASCFEDAIDDAGALAAVGDEDGGEVGRCCECEPAALEQGVAASDEASEGVAEKGSALELGIDLGAEVERMGVEEHRVDSEIDIAGL